MSPTGKHLKDIEIVGGHPALDFVNTVHSWRMEPAPDYLHGFDDLLAWQRNFDLVGRHAATRWSAAPEAEKARAFRGAVALRAALRRIFAAAAAGEPVPVDPLDHLTGVVRRTARWRRLAADEGTGRRMLRWVWELTEAPATAIVGPVAWQAADLLAEGNLDRLKECPGDNCGWLFLDTSRNRSRTWCSMKTCGNAAKVKRFRQRAK